MWTSVSRLPVSVSFFIFFWSYFLTEEISTFHVLFIVPSYRATSISVRFIVIWPTTSWLVETQSRDVHHNWTMNESRTAIGHGEVMKMMHHGSRGFLFITQLPWMNLSLMSRQWCKSGWNSGGCWCGSGRPDGGGWDGEVKGSGKAPSSEKKDFFTWNYVFWCSQSGIICPCPL